MKVKLTEAQIRALLRERIARRLLVEESPEPQSRPGGISLGDVVSHGFQTLGGKLGGIGLQVDPVKSSIYGQKFVEGQAQTAIEAISQLTGAEIVMGYRGIVFKAGAGQKIQDWQKDYTAWMRESVTFSDEDPLKTWKNNHKRFSRVKGFNAEGMPDANYMIELPDDARGLLAYLLLTQMGETATKQIEDLASALEAIGSDLNATIDSWVETFKINKMVTGDKGIKVAEQLLEIVNQDSNEKTGCARTRYALAKFAIKNTTYGESTIGKALDLGMWAYTIATLPATVTGLAAMATGMSLRAARALSLAAPLADDAVKLGTVAGARANVASKFAAVGDEAVLGAKEAAKAAETAKRVQTLAQAEGEAAKARASLAALNDEIESARFIDDIDVPEDMESVRRRFSQAYRDNKSMSDDDAMDLMSDIIGDTSPTAPTAPGASPMDMLAQQEDIADQQEALYKFIQSFMKKIGDKTAALEKERAAAKAAVDEADEAVSAAKFRTLGRDTAELEDLEPGIEKVTRRRAQVVKFANPLMTSPVSNPRIVFTTIRDFAAATGIRGFLGVALPSGIQTTALGWAVLHGWEKASRKEILEVAAAMSISDMLGELADEFTNTFFMNYYVAEGIDEVEDAIYVFAESKKFRESDLSALKQSLISGISVARQEDISSEDAGGVE